MRRTLLFALAGLLLATAGLAAEPYQLDTSHSYVGFSVRHLAVSNVRGEFKQYSGTFAVDEQNLASSTAEFHIQTSSIATENDDRDKHLKSPDFFDAAKFPEIVFKSKRIEKKGEGYAITGDFTMKGVTKEIQIPFTVAGPIKDPWGNTRLGVEAEVTLNRQDYGVSWNKTLDAGGLVVGNDVKITLAFEVVKKAPQPPKPASGS